MQIAGVHAELPSRVVTNGDILEMLQTSCDRLSRVDARTYLQVVERVLNYSGANQRYWLGPDQSPGELLERSVAGALADAQMGVEDIDTVIYAAVSRGFLEPAESYVLADNCGLRPDHCFDVLEACNSFSRAADLAQLMINAGRSRHVLIAVGEFCVNGSQFVRPTFEPHSVDELSWRFPSYTLGECAVSMVLTPGGDDWSFRVKTQTELARSCLVTLPDGLSYAPGLELGEEEIGVFRSFAKDMHRAAVPATTELWERFQSEDPELADTTDIMFPHSPSSKLCEDFSKATAFPSSKIFDLFDRHGNIGSASVPVGIYLARQEGRLRRGDHVTCLVGAAGMSFMLYDFVF